MRTGQNTAPRSRLALVPVALWLSVSIAAASQVRQVNLEDMTTRATSIFSGRCVGVATVADPDLGEDVTVATFRVVRSAKGAERGTVQVRMPAGGEMGGGVAGLPDLEPGDQVILFLYGENALGLRTPVGFGQGRFKIETNAKGRPVARNDFGNRELLRGLSPPAKALLPTPSAGVPSTDLSPDALLDWVEAFVGSAP